MITIDKYVIEIIAAGVFTIIAAAVYGVAVYYLRKQIPGSTPLWVIIGCGLALVPVDILWGADVTIGVAIILATFVIAQIPGYYLTHGKKAESKSPFAAAMED